MTDKLGTATFAAGCFWCVEAVFQSLEGVRSVVPGYTGGTAAAPSYEEVCAGATGHAEAVQIRFDPAVISFEELLEVFWHTHDPTTPNRQGPDAGAQYRSAIFYHDEDQRLTAERSRAKIAAARLWPGLIVTEIAPFQVFHEAEACHRDYFRSHPEQAYCRTVIGPKIQKFRKGFAARLKKE